jgi:tRNA threonylcarbamoyl adenosine modification protein (Sua5/YciO/YrdC/YwlC family)
MLIKIYEDNPSPEQIRKVVEVLNNGGIIIFPTDTVYAFGCDIFNARAVETIVKLKNKDARKPNLSFVCHEMSQISEYAKMDDAAFKLMKKNLPGPFTFLLRGSNRLPKLFKNKKEVGIRIPNNSIALAIVQELGNPLMVSSVFRDEEVPEYATDPELICEKFGCQVDLIVDGGMGGIEPSTVVDCTEADEYMIVRQGVGALRE